MLRWKDKIKSWMGPLWWYAAILFIVQRFGDVINMFVGLWLVPRYVPQSELGAVLPLAQIGSVLGLPLMIVLGPFGKFLNTYATHGEYGKVKSLLRDGVLLMGLLFLGTMLYAKFILPPVFLRMRVAEGSLGFLIILSGAVAAATPIATTALQGLKKFGMVTYVGLWSAPVRLITMLLCLPIRGLSGYFVGQMVPSLLTMCIAFFGLRDILGRNVKSESYWRQDGRRILAYMVPCGIIAFLGVMQITVEAFVIRHRLCDLESAAYYMISRFAETGAYMGMTLTFIGFPLMAERHEKGKTSGRLLWHSIGGALAAGLFLALTFFFLGSRLFGAVNLWRPFTAFVPQMALLTLLHAFRVATACFINYEMACRRTSFLVWYGLPLVFETVVLYSLTGYSFFSTVLPDAWMKAIIAFNPCRLTVVLAIMSIFTFLPFCALIAHEFKRRKRCADEQMRILME